jgi:hypothetical protein
LVTSEIELSETAIALAPVVSAHTEVVIGTTLVMRLVDSPAVPVTVTVKIWVE